MYALPAKVRLNNLNKYLFVIILTDIAIAILILIVKQFKMTVVFVFCRNLHQMKMLY